ncbi:hypothetical protein ACFFTM_19580 [Pseudoduganella plicata]|uniref:Uncharacterized protein n=1 Tax=Pseudoduganella plicata TaxID=321984 RepID=A0A4V1ATW4_9BURK|nr:hypothetical protein [Pseudoduganella plicata]QBQ37078.1 hypothetical protein E1742_13535 [Pseudoduganella plicata]GGY99554.1 hypothetical protein GCM10007388_36500 [Pseudoduganella plicata]
MEDPKQPQAAAPVPQAKRRSRWLSALLYALAACGLIALVLSGVAYYQHKKATAVPEYLTIDAAAVIEKTMAEKYGKYSATRKGWLYVDEDNRAYVMRVVQQKKMRGADGDELYFLASGEGWIDDDRASVYGVFHIRPTRPRDGTLVEISQPAIAGYGAAIKREDVRFEALSKNSWGWFVRVADGMEPTMQRALTHNVVWAPRENGMAKLGQFMAAADQDPGMPCDEAKQAYDEWLELPEAERRGVEPTGAPRCERQRWSYRTGKATDATPVPITVTLGGTLDGKPVASRKWTLKFDTKHSRYTVPAELEDPAQ